MKHTKITVIGAGAVGSTTVYALMLKNIAAEIILVDRDKDRCKGEAFDLSDALSFSETSKITSSHQADGQQSNIVIITAGVPQLPGQSRMQLLDTNGKIVTSIIEDLKPLDKNTIIIVVTNPVDVMTLYAQQAAGLPRGQVFGTGTFLDSQRMKGLLSKKLNIAEQSIHAHILGEHGDSQFPVWSSAQIAGVPILDFAQLTQKDLDTLALEVKQKAHEIIKCKGSTFFGIAACTSAICESIIFDKKRIVPVSTFIEQFGLCLSMPAVLGCNGIEQIIPVPLNKKEKAQMEQSAQKIKNAMSKS